MNTIAVSIGINFVIFCLEDQMTNFPILGVLCGGFFLLLFLGVGIWLIVRSIRERNKVDESQGWPTTLGQVIQNSVAESVATSDDGVTSYHPEITYSYKVHGQDYESSRIMIGAVPSGSQKSARDVTARFPPGASVTVYYNPSDPRESILERKSKSASASMVIGIIFIVISIATFCVMVGSIAVQYLK
jgi:hypothetical protein